MGALSAEPTTTAPPVVWGGIPRGKGRWASGKATGYEADPEEEPLKNVPFNELIAKADDLLRRGKEMFLAGTEGMARQVPWLAPLPNSEVHDPNMFVFGNKIPDVSSVGDGLFLPPVLETAWCKCDRKGRVRWCSLSPGGSDSENPSEAVAEQGFQGHSTRR